MPKKLINDLLLFDCAGIDEFYLTVKNECYDWCFPAKKYWQNLYSKFCCFLDNNFITELSIDSFSRLWEITLISYLAGYEKNGLKLIEMSGKASKPDFCFDLHGNRFYLETVCSSPGGVDELNVPLSDTFNKARRTPITEYMERLCSSIKEKAHTKYHGKCAGGYKDYMEKESGLIIAISTAKIPFHNQPNNFQVDLRCIFGMSPMKFPLIHGSNSKIAMGAPYHEPQFSFAKRSNKNAGDLSANIEMNYFSNDQYSHVSGIIISHTPLVFFPDIDRFVDYCHWKQCRNDYILIHNPFASVPLPQNFFEVDREVTAQNVDDVISIKVSNPGYNAYCLNEDLMS